MNLEIEILNAKDDLHKLILTPGHGDDIFVSICDEEEGALTIAVPLDELTRAIGALNAGAP